MGAGAFIEPLVVVSLLFGGTWLNRNKNYRLFASPRHARHTNHVRSGSPDSLESGMESPTDADGLLSPRPTSPSLLAANTEPKWRKRELRLLGFRTTVTSPNTRVFQDRFLSRVLLKFSFLVEAWYWALIYWVYQLGRAFSALTLVEGTVTVARKHALQLIRLEQSLHIFWEPTIQSFFLAHPTAMTALNRLYSFIHIPGTILFLVLLYAYTPTTPSLYTARRRTMATCNLLAFAIFTAWPCMPPRLLSDPTVPGETGDLARSFGFVDTVHAATGESSVWTTNRFCNQYAAMPSLHFGYALLIGVTIATLPVRGGSCGTSVRLSGSLRLRLPAWRRVLCVVAGVAYPTAILIAIVATANHFLVDAVAGAGVCAVAWWGNEGMLNLLAVEDWFLWGVRICKPERVGEEEEGWERDGKGVLRA